MKRTISRRILILFELHPNKLGSLEEFCMFLARELTTRGDLCYLTFTAEPAQEIKTLMQEAGARIADIFGDTSRVSKRRKKSAIANAAALYRFVRDEKIDLVHINFYPLTSPCLIGVYLSGASIVFTDHTSGGFPERGLLKNLTSRAIHSLLAKRIARYVAVSDFVRNRLAVSHHVGPDKTLTIYNGINVERFVPRDRTMAREQMKLPKDAKIIVAVAMLIPEKGLQYLIEAASILIKEFGITNICVAVAGEGSYRETLERMTEKLGIANNVRLLGRRSDVDLLIASSDVVVVPAVWAESFGLIIAEAMASGRPVVASRVGGIPELIDDQESGLMFEAGDSHGLAHAIYRLFIDEVLAQQLIENAMWRVMSVFNMSNQVVRIADLYNEVLCSS